MDFYFKILFLLISGTVFAQDCILPDGKYNVNMDKEFQQHPVFEFEIIQDSMVFYYPEEKVVKRKIKKNQDCFLVLEKEEINEEGITEFKMPSINKIRFIPLKKYLKMNIDLFLDPIYILKPIAEFL